MLCVRDKTASYVKLNKQIKVEPTGLTPLIPEGGFDNLVFDEIAYGHFLDSVVEECAELGLIRILSWRDF
jgi:hypothetical protein